jgi:uncharacterized protein YndB with AHSA1/START domain
MLKIIAIAAVVTALLLAAVLTYAATRPDVFRVQRSLVVNAPPDKIYALVNDLRSWSAWSPYEHKDPAMKRTYEGAASGKGAIYGWDGNKNVGRGRMEIIEASPPGKIVIKLDFIKPFEAHNTVEFTMAPTSDGTTVTWAMYGPNLFIGKVMGLFLDMDKMVGGDFEAGLASLKVAAEK